MALLHWDSAAAAVAVNFGCAVVVEDPVYIPAAVNENLTEVADDPVPVTKLLVVDVHDLSVVFEGSAAQVMV